jgi:TadE-like protein
MRSLVKYLLRFARCSSGNALVEMTIVVPVAISLMVGGVDFGLALTTQATASKSVRDAARYLGSLRASECTAQIAGAQNLAVYGNLAVTRSYQTGMQVVERIIMSISLADPPSLCRQIFHILLS